MIGESFFHYPPTNLIYIFSVFVVANGMEVGRPADSHRYWKMRIQSLHHDNQQEKVWVVGSWFYSPSDLENIGLAQRWIIINLYYTFFLLTKPTGTWNLFP